jgi:secreted trypsin-like serine protease
LRKLLLAALAALLVTGTAGAITNGEADNGRHPYVGMIGFIVDGKNAHLCSGTLVAPRVVLTAGHCTSGAEAAVVWFNEQALSTQPSGFGFPVTHPDFSPTLDVPNTGDIGVVLLAAPVHMAQYGQLPKAGFLDTFKSRKGRQDLGVTIVGYGLEAVKPEPVFNARRMMGTAQIRNLNSNNVRDYGLQTSNSPGLGSGTCEGDSGGPILYGDSNVVIGVNSWAQNPNCIGNDFSYRTDTASARGFLAQFGVPLP